MGSLNRSYISLAHRDQIDNLRLVSYKCRHTNIGQHVHSGHIHTHTRTHVLTKIDIMMSQYVRVLLLLLVTLVIAELTTAYQVPPARRNCILTEVVSGRKTDDDAGCLTKVNIDSSFSPMERVALTCNGNLQRVMSAYYGTTVEVKVKRCDNVAYGVYDREVDLIAFGKVFCTAIGQISTTDARCMDAVASNKIGIGQLFASLGVLPEFALFMAERTLCDASAGTVDDKSYTRKAIQSSKRGIFEKVHWLQGKHDSYYRPTEKSHVLGNDYHNENDASADVETSMLQDSLLWREYELSCPQMTCTFVEIFAPDFLNLSD